MITTLWEPINAYGIEHLALVLFCIAASVLAVRLVKKAPKERVIFVTGVILALLEVLKQLLMSRIYAAYSWTDLPFQLCSIPMYMCLLHPVLKGRSELTEDFLRSFGLLGAVCAFAFPYDVFSDYLLLALHSMVWHTVLLFLGLYCIAVSEPEKRVNFKRIRDLCLLYLGLAAAAIAINALLRNVSNGTSNMFFLGPSKPCVLVLDDIYRERGWIAASLVMILCSEAAGIFVLLLGNLIRRSSKEK